jgi:hypothetical protein
MSHRIGQDRLNPLRATQAHVYGRPMLSRSKLLVCSSVLALAGCDLILGLDEYKEGPATGGAGGGASNASTTADSTTTTTSTSSSSSGDSSSSSSTGGMMCTPDAVEDCPYNGTPGTEGHGLCVVGRKMCNHEGTAFGPCLGEVRDSAEVCGDGLDQDCDDTPDDGCACTPNTSAPCYTGPAMNENVGLCVDGMQTCNAQGTSYGACTGDVLPAPEDCATAADENCNGREPMNNGVDDTAGCECVGTSSTTCYTGPTGTQNVGKCKDGMKSCVAGHWGMCGGQTLPGTESCSATGDEDCNGLSCSEVAWTQNGGTHGYDVAVDPAGNVYWTGDFQGVITIGGMNLVSAGGTDIFLTKWTPQGTLIWAKRFGGSADESPLGIAADASNVYIASTGAADFGSGTAKHVAKLSGATGSHVWSRGCNTTFIPGVAIGSGGTVSVDPNGNVLVAGTFPGTSLTCEGNTVSGNAGGGRAGLVWKLSSAGTNVWAKSFTDPQNKQVYFLGLDTDSSGSIWIAGRTDSITSFGCGGAALGTTYSAATVVKLDSTGNCSFQKKYDTGYSVGTSVAVSSLGGPVLAGYFADAINLTGTTLTTTNTDAFAVQLNSSGTAQWASTQDGLLNTDVAVDTADNVLLAQSTGTLFPPFDGVVRKLGKANGAIVWTRPFTGSGAFGVAAGGGQNLVFASLDSQLKRIDP